MEPNSDRNMGNISMIIRLGSPTGAVPSCGTVIHLDTNLLADCLLGRSLHQLTAEEASDVTALVQNRRLRRRIPWTSDIRDMSYDSQATWHADNPSSGFAKAQRKNSLVIEMTGCYMWDGA